MPEDPLSLRPRVPGDDPGIIVLHNRVEADSAPLSVARYRAERSVVSGEPAGEVWVAEDSGQVVGVGEFHPAWWTSDPTSYSLALRVDPLHEQQGIGGRLFTELTSRLWDAGASRLLT